MAAFRCDFGGGSGDGGARGFQGETVAFFSHDLGFWKANLFKPFLEKGVYREVMGCYTPNSYAGEDHTCWALSPTGEFTTRSTFNLLTDRQGNESREW